MMVGYAQKDQLESVKDVMDLGLKLRPRSFCTELYIEYVRILSASPSTSDVQQLKDAWQGFHSRVPLHAQIAIPGSFNFLFICLFIFNVFGPFEYLLVLPCLLVSHPGTPSQGAPTQGNGAARARTRAMDDVGLLLRTCDRNYLLGHDRDSR